MKYNFMVKVQIKGKIDSSSPEEARESVIEFASKSPKIGCYAVPEANLMEVAVNVEEPIIEMPQERPRGKKL